MKKMVSHLVLVFGLFYAGFTVGETSCAASEGSAQLKSTSDLEKSEMRFDYHRGKKEMFCNECLKTVFQIIKRAANAKEEGGSYFDQVEPCTDFSYKQYRICTDVIDFIRDSGMLNIMETRKFCARAKYCPPKRQRPVIIPNDDYTNDYDWNERKSRPSSRSKNCRMKMKSEPNMGYSLQNAEENEAEAALQSINSASTCQDCEVIMKRLKRYVGSNKPPISFMLPYLCEEFRGQTKTYCFRIMSQYSEKITVLTLEKKTTHAICTAIKQCTGYPYCRACQDYVEALKNDDYIPMDEACLYLQWNEKNQCVRSLQDKSDQITGLAYREEDRYTVCKVAQLCPAMPLPLIPEPNYLTMKF